MRILVGLYGIFLCWIGSKEKEYCRFVYLIIGFNFVFNVCDENCNFVVY